MKVFLAFGYNERDEWIPKRVFPLVKALGLEFETGEETYGDKIDEVVRTKIRMSDGLIGFRTRRGDPQNGTWNTHKWVTEEIAVALDRGKKILEVRESKVEEQAGMPAGYQRIDYDEAARDKCLVEIAVALGRWKASHPVAVRLNLKDTTDEQFRVMFDGGLVCRYNLRLGNEEFELKSVDIIDIGKNEYFVNIPSYGKDTLVRIELEYGPKKWNSSYSRLDLCGIDLKKVP